MPKVVTSALIKSLLEATSQQELQDVIGVNTTISLYNSGEAIPAAGTIVYLSSVDSKWYLTDASAEATSGPVKVGVALAAVAGADLPMDVQTAGLFTTTGLTPGLQWLSETAGALTATAPTADGSVRRIFGYAPSSTELYVDPSKEWVVAGIDAAIINEQVGLTYTLVIGDHQAIVERNNGNPNTTTIPNGTLPVGFEGDLMQVGSGLSSIVGAVGVTVNGVLEEGGNESQVNSQGQWKGFSLYQRSANAWVVIGKAEA